MTENKKDAPPAPAPAPPPMPRPENFRKQLEILREIGAGKVSIGISESVWKKAALK